MSTSLTKLGPRVHAVSHPNHFPPCHLSVVTTISESRTEIASRFPESRTFQHAKRWSPAEQRVERPVRRAPGGVGTTSSTLNPDEHSLPGREASPKKSRGRFDLGVPPKPPRSRGRTLRLREGTGNRGCCVAGSGGPTV